MRPPSIDKYFLYFTTVSEEAKCGPWEAALLMVKNLEFRPPKNADPEVGQDQLSRSQV